jgi:hypothetical protein
MRVLEDFIQDAPGVSFMRKVDIVNYAITSPRTVREDIYGPHEWKTRSYLGVSGRTAAERWSTRPGTEMYWLSHA